MLQLGIVDFDSSHSIEFTRRFNQVGVDGDQCVAGARVVRGCPGTSRMAPERIAGFAREIEECGVKLVDSPEEMIGDIDGVLILSLCGEEHLRRVRPFLEAGIPAFVDKPLACNLDDAVEMLRLAKENDVMLFHSSALPFSEGVLTFQQQRDRLGEVLGAISYGPAKEDEANPGLFHYGIHAVAVLFAVMGTGCIHATNSRTEGSEVVTGLWEENRIGTLRGNRVGSTSYGFVAFCENGVIHQPISTRYAYRNLCRSIVEAFEQRTSPVSEDLILEQVRFVLAAQQSDWLMGEHVPLRAVA